MRPKVESAIDFARAGGETLITSFDALEPRSKAEPARASPPDESHVRCLAPAVARLDIARFATKPKALTTTRRRRTCPVPGT